MQEIQRKCKSMKKQLKFSKPDVIVFIGGGLLMAECIDFAKSINFPVKVILAPRHAKELMANGKNLEERLLEIGFDVHVVSDINSWAGIEKIIGQYQNPLALCFGPTWIFNNKLIKLFTAGMYNFNGIPIPHYLGGAHYTWQILNNDRRGGCFFQEITEHLDRGDILRYAYYDLPERCRVPEDYFKVNHDIGLIFIKNLLNDIKQGITFDRIPYAKFNSDRLYFPRLFTSENSYIDWRWSGQEIEKFCNAFDRPYEGAATFWRCTKVRFRSVYFCSDEINFHPFLSGLVVRKHSSFIWIAVRGGLIKVSIIVDLNEQNLYADIREGDRMITSEENLFHSKSFRPEYNSFGVTWNPSESQ